MIATGGASGNPVTFSIDPTTSASCSISGSTVTFTTARDCTIDANEAGTANYDAAPEARQSFPVAALVVTKARATPVVTIKTRTLTITGGGYTTARLACSLAPCRGTVTITEHQVTHVKKGDKTVDVKRTIVLGKRSYSIAAGKSATVTITLDAAGRRVALGASRMHPLHVTLKVTVSGGRTRSKTVKVAWSSRRKHLGLRAGETNRARRAGGS